MMVIHITGKNSLFTKDLARKEAERILSGKEDEIIKEIESLPGVRSTIGSIKNFATDEFLEAVADGEAVGHTIKVKDEADLYVIAQLFHLCKKRTDDPFSLVIKGVDAGDEYYLEHGYYVSKREAEELEFVPKFTNASYYVREDFTIGLITTN